MIVAVETTATAAPAGAPAATASAGRSENPKHQENQELLPAIGNERPCMVLSHTIPIEPRGILSPPPGLGDSLIHNSFNTGLRRGKSKWQLPIPEFSIYSGRMSMMTSFFVAPVAEIQTSKLNEGVPAAFPSVLCAYLDDVKVAILEHVLTAKDPKECLKAVTAQPVYTHDESGIEVYRIGDDLVKALAALYPQSPLEQAQKWMSTGDWGRFGRRTGDLRDLVDTLASICKLASTAATTPAQGLFLWVCP